METPISLGKRIKYFRERAGLSQLQVEIALDTSSGTICRIEKDNVNPTKETVLRFAKVVGMNHREIDYVIGATCLPVTPEDIIAAKCEVIQYFSQKVLAYLIDDRWRLWMISDYFCEALGITNDYVQSVLGTVSLQFLLDPKLGLQDKFDNRYAEEMYTNNLYFYHKEVGFMHDDPYYERTLMSIMQNPLAKKVWREITSKSHTEYNFKFGRKVYFKLYGNISIPLNYTYEPLLSSSRFVVVAYTPHGAMANLLSAFV